MLDVIVLVLFGKLVNDLLDIDDLQPKFIPDILGQRGLARLGLPHDEHYRGVLHVLGNGFVLL